MKLLEYEAKELLARESLPIPNGRIITSPTDISTLTAPTVLKSQVPVGGRGKLGGVVIVEQTAKIAATVSSLQSLKIKGYTPKVILAEEKIQIQNEHYLSLLVDRATSDIRLVAHTSGGVEVENNNSTDFLNIAINAASLTDCSRALARYLGYEESLIQPLLVHLYDAFIKNDALLLEINPLIYTQEDTFVCGDCKMELDDMAAFRHTNWNFEEKLGDTNFVVLNKKGTIGTIANGAGLAMATVDAVASKGMMPANFLDIGGGADTESVLKAFQKIVEFEDIRAIVINIFAGITRCDEVAKAIITAKEQIRDLPPLFIRLAGTNFEKAAALLEAQHIQTLSTLEECLLAAKGAKNE